MLFSDDMLEKKSAMGTLTFRNGLICQFLANGSVLQMMDVNLTSEDKDQTSEANRLITVEGIVIRQMHNRDAEVIYPNGLRANFSKKNMEWIVTNNKGKRRAFKDDSYRDLEPVPCATETDAVSLAKMMIREDNVTTVTYKDGSVFCQHEDGTQIHTSADGSEIRIEKQGFASHTLQIVKDYDSRPLTSPNILSIEQRAIDKKILKT